MSKIPSPPGRMQFHDTDGITPLVSGRVITYLAGTTTPAATYSNRSGSAVNTNPIVLDSRGMCDCFLSPGVVYDLIVKRPAGDETVVESRLGVFANDDSVISESVDAYGAVGDGVTSDQAAFVAALAAGRPVYVPYTDDFYSLSSLTNAQLMLLWGPGLVKVAGVVTPIASSPTFDSDDLSALTVTKPELTPTQYPGIQGSIGNAAANIDVTRTGGFATYGSVLNRLHVTAAVPAGQFDVGMTTWCGNTNMTGGQMFAGWDGANTPSSGLGQTYSGGAVIGREINVGNRWADFGLQTDVGGTRYTVGLQVTPDVLPAKDGIDTKTVSGITIASPGVVTVTAHGMPAWTGFVFSGAGTLPTGLTKGQLYYVSSTGLATDTFQVAASVGGASINTTGSFAGPITITPSWAGSFGHVVGASIWGHRWWTGMLCRYNTIMAGGYWMLANGGSIAGTAPGALVKMNGYWDRGIDARSVVFANHAIDLQNAAYTSGAPINFDFTATHSGTATPGGVASPGNFQGFLKLAMNGSFIKVPYFQN